MAEPVAIAERIERELTRRMTAALAAWLAADLASGRVNAADVSAAGAVNGGAGGACRWDADEDGDLDTPLFVPVLVPDADEESRGGGDGGVGYTTNAQAFGWMLRWQKRAGVGETAQQLHRRWVSRLELVLVVDDQLLEGGDGVPLIVDMEKTGAGLLEPVKGQAEFCTFLEFEVTYDTKRGDPYTGPAVPVLME